MLVGASLERSKCPGVTVLGQKERGSCHSSSPPQIGSHRRKSKKCNNWGLQEQVPKAQGWQQDWMQMTDQAPGQCSYHNWVLSAKERSSIPYPAWGERQCKRAKSGVTQNDFEINTVNSNYWTNRKKLRHFVLPVVLWSDLLLSEPFKPGFWVPRRSWFNLAGRAAELICAKAMRLNEYHPPFWGLFRFQSSHQPQLRVGTRKAAQKASSFSWTSPRLFPFLQMQHCTFLSHSSLSAHSPLPT